MTPRALLLLALLTTVARAQAPPITGKAVTGMRSYDDTVAALMARYHVPGGAVAVMKNGRLVYARGFGWAEAEHRIPAAPDALFRIASVSKPITSAAVMTLVEAGRLSLDQPVLPFLDDLPAARGAVLDPRWNRITIRLLLEHAGGWDRDASFDPMFRPDSAARAVGAPMPATAGTIIRYMKGVPLDFDPGTRSAYSNFGYAILSHVIERVTGERSVRYNGSAGVNRRARVGG